MIYFVFTLILYMYVGVRAGYESHIEELEQQINKDRSEGILKEAEELRTQLQQKQLRYAAK